MPLVCCMNVVVSQNVKDSIDVNNLPAHVAVIMDGNGRWAKSKGAMRIFGHHHGITAVRETVEGCAELGVGFLTLYTFSTENWERPKLEVEFLMKLIEKYLKKELEVYIKNNIKFKAIGRKFKSIQNKIRFKP